MTDRTEAFFQDLEDYVARAGAMLAEGRELELRELNTLAERLCDEARAMPAERADYTARFAAAIADLNMLATALTERRAEVAEQLRSLAGNRKASTAYRSVQASDIPRKEDE